MPSPADGPLTGTERAVLGEMSLLGAHELLDDFAAQRLGSPIASVRFRAGRIDVVWGVELGDGRLVVIKVHRPPVDLDALGAALEAQRQLIAQGFPCPEPLTAPHLVDGRVLTAETLLVGDAVDGRDPVLRRLLAAGLSEHIELLRARADLLPAVGDGPSWCRYQDGPWPIPHDPIVDFETTPEAYAWLDVFAEQATRQIVANRISAPVVLGHADWYAGNAAVRHGSLVASYDWELVADTEAVIAGFTAACYAASPTSGGGLSSPAEVAAFLRDYEAVTGRRFDRQERRAAAASAAWIVAFNARWQVGLLGSGIEDLAVVEMLHAQQAEYLALG